jgi:Cu+-exporting ATPase
VSLRLCRRVIFNQGEGATHLGRCCCGRLLWVGGADAVAVVRSHRERETDYFEERDLITLPWGEDVTAALAVPVKRLQAEARLAARTASGTRVRDVVCGMTIDAGKAAATSVYGGETYYFCAPVCKARFDAGPARYLAGDEQ